MIYSGNTPAYVSEKAYKDIEGCLEVWFNSESNPFKHIFQNARRINRKEITEKLDLVIEDYNEDEELILVTLQSKENSGYQPYKQVFHKQYGEIE